VIDGQAGCATSLLPVGASTVTGSYGGDGNYVGSSASSNATVSKAVVTAVPVSVLGPGPNLVRTYTFGVSGFPVDATGAVAFLYLTNGTTQLCQATLTAGSASCIAAVAGHGTVYASYAGDTNYAALSTLGVSVSPAKASSRISFDQPSADITPAPGDDVQFAASVSATATDASAPTGNVTFSIGARAACTASVMAGKASCEAVIAATDSGSLSASYSGDPMTLGGTATGVSVTVLIPPPVPASTPSASTNAAASTTTTTTPAVTTPPVTTTDAPPPSSPPDTTTTPTTTTSAPSAPTRQLVIQINTKPGVEVAGAPLVVSGSGLQPGSTVEVTVHSAPILLGNVTVGPDGSFHQVFAIPAGLPAGSHHLIVSGIGADGLPITRTTGFAVDVQGRFGAATPKPPRTHVVKPVAKIVPAVTPPAPAAGPTLAKFEPRHHTHQVVDTFVGGFALLSVLGAAGAAGAAAGGGSGRSTRHGHKSAKVTSAKVKHRKFRWEGEATGDAGWTWRAPGWAALDRLSLEVPVRLAPPAPLAARLLTDASYLRAIFGSASLVFPVAAIGLGIAAAASSGGDAVPPVYGLVIALAIVGVFDALAGFLGAVVFAVGVAAQGGIDSSSAVRTMLGICALWFAVPLIAAAARPFRRPIEDLGLDDVWTHVADLVIAALIGAWATQKIVGALPGLSGVELPLTAHLNSVALVVLAAIVVRFAVETSASLFFPRRLTEVQPPKIPFSSPRQRLLSLAFRTGLFVFVAVAYLGECWELWAGAALFAVPQILGIYESRFPNSERLHRVLPGGIAKTVLMLFVGQWFFIQFHERVSSAHLLTYGFVILGLPSLAFSALELVGRDGEDPDETWLHRLAGLGILLLGVLFVLGIVTI
jgi:hypothetical protein